MSAKLTFEDCESLLPILIQTYSQTILVLDALDEIKEKAQRDLIAFLTVLIEKSQHLTIFISSWHDADIKCQLEKKANFRIVKIEATDKSENISKFVAEKINQAQKHQHNAISDGLQNGIIKTLLEGSQGMWVVFYLTSRFSDLREYLGFNG